MKTLGIIAAVVGLGAVAWYFTRSSVPVGVAAPDPGFTSPSGGVSYGDSGVAQAIVFGGAHSEATSTAPKLAPTFVPSTGGLRATPPPPTTWRKI